MEYKQQRLLTLEAAITAKLITARIWGGRREERTVFLRPPKKSWQDQKSGGKDTSLLQSHVNVGI